jgi:hypothetical protein
LSEAIEWILKNKLKDLEKAPTRVKTIIIDCFYSWRLFQVNQTAKKDYITCFGISERKKLCGMGHYENHKWLYFDDCLETTIGAPTKSFTTVSDFISTLEHKMIENLTKHD